MSLIQATIRSTKTRGELNALRKSGNVPGIIYGGENENEKISLSKKEVKNATQVYIATDPDREGEGIAWHLIEVLKIKYRRVYIFQY